MRSANTSRKGQKPNAWRSTPGGACCWILIAVRLSAQPHGDCRSPRLSYSQLKFASTIFIMILYLYKNADVLVEQRGIHLSP